ncbi:GAF domain-containing protein [Chryseolinea sp. T2]|uniref:GAF domain-containing protein n=1 Tax=Chryseolinea sp. T2 TaxID=3129255 RepID=UPI00307892C9
MGGCEWLQGMLTKNLIDFILKFVASNMYTYQNAYLTALDMISSGRASREVLSYLALSAERSAESESVSSILVLDESGVLRNGASPRLPGDYLKAIDGLVPNPEVGTCAAAAATGRIVITENFFEDSKWAELRHLPLALGFKGAWSFPIKNPEGKVIGTFGTYFKSTRQPTKREIDGTQMLAKAAAVAINR